MSKGTLARSDDAGETDTLTSDGRRLPEGTPVELIAHRPETGGHFVTVRVTTGPCAGQMLRLSYWDVRWSPADLWRGTTLRMKPLEV